MSYLWWVLGGVGAYLLFRQGAVEKVASTVGPPTTGTLAIPGLEVAIGKCMQSQYGSKAAVTAQAAYVADSNFPIRVTYTVSVGGVQVASAGSSFRSVAELQSALLTCAGW